MCSQVRRKNRHPVIKVNFCETVFEPKHTIVKATYPMGKMKGRYRPSRDIKYLNSTGAISKKDRKKRKKV